MNQLEGKIQSCTEAEGLVLLEINIGGSILHSIVIAHVDNTYYTDQPITVLFKETEVSISKKTNAELSIQNRLKAEITGIKSGQLLSEISMKFNKSKLNSVITTKSVEKLKLNIGDPVEALIKTNEIMLAK